MVTNEQRRRLFLQTLNLPEPWPQALWAVGGGAGMVVKYTSFSGNIIFLATRLDSWKQPRGQGTSRNLELDSSSGCITCKINCKHRCVPSGSWFISLWNRWSGGMGSWTKPRMTLLGEWWFSSYTYKEDWASFLAPTFYWCLYPVTYSVTNGSGF